MSTNHELRSGFKWTVNECLRLEREFDLLKLSVEDIALLHQRSNYAIMYKLDSEGIADFNDLYEQTYPNEASNESESEVSQEEDDSESEVSDDDDEESYQDDTQELNDNDSEASKEYEDEDDDDESEDGEYDRFDLKHQVRTLTKQLSNLTAIVYKSLIKDSRTSNVLFR
jgi:hypothetical protein